MKKLTVVLGSLLTIGLLFSLYTNHQLTKKISQCNSDLSLQIQDNTSNITDLNQKLHLRTEMLISAFMDVNKKHSQLEDKQKEDELELAGLKITSTNMHYDLTTETDNRVNGEAQLRETMISLALYEKRLLESIAPASVGIASFHVEEKDTIMNYGCGICLAPHYVITAFHNIETNMANGITIEFFDPLTGSKCVSLKATVDSFDKKNDIALLKLNDDNPLPAWVTFDPENMIATPTSAVYTIGNTYAQCPYNVTRGYFTRIGNRITNQDGLYCMSTTVSQGNSGGGVFDAITGKLIGMVTRTAGPNLSLFLPISTIAEFLKDKKEIIEADIKAAPQPVDEEEGFEEEMDETKGSHFQFKLVPGEEKGEDK